MCFRDLLLSIFVSVRNIDKKNMCQWIYMLFSEKVKNDTRIAFVDCVNLTLLFDIAGCYDWYFPTCMFSKYFIVVIDLK